MSSTLPSEEVAADFLESLQDLQVNNRYEITNLTVIAKENTEHAMAISRVIENYIKQTAPPRKLLGLYVLDSIVKNVGTPYTIYLGRNLYSTFMDAYTLVDPQTRKHMDAVLKTWKDPIPNSAEARPVFSAEITRKIDNALIKARTAAVQQQQLQARSQRQFHSLPSRPNMPNQTLWRDTPTPPSGIGGYPPPPLVQDGYNGRGHASEVISPPSFAPQNPVPFMHSQLPHIGMVPNSFPQEGDSLQTDLERLIVSTREEFAANMYDPGVQQKLKALLDLQTILNSQLLPHHERQMIKDQVAQLSATSRDVSNIALSTSQQYLTPGPPPSQNLSHFHQAPSHYAVSGSAPIPTFTSISTTNLAQILASVSSQQNGTPIPPTVSFSVNSQPTTSIASTENPLLAQLRAAGILGGTINSPQPAPSTLAQTLTNTSSHIPPVHQSLALPSSTGRAPLLEIKNEIKLTSSSLKQEHPSLIKLLYDSIPNQCTTCGRRFPGSEGGKECKARHLDWHFKTNQRLQDAAKRPQNRSFYIGELEWIKFRELDNANDEPDSYPGVGNENGPQGASKSTTTQRETNEPYIKAPSDSSLVNQTCPICQERFEAVWHEATQDWVWPDAVRVGNRIFHASCYAEVNRDQAQSLGKSGLDITILGKRKAETDENLNSRMKIKVDGD